MANDSDPDLAVVLSQLPPEVRGRVERLDCRDLREQLTTPVPALDGLTFVEASSSRREELYRVLERWEEMFGTRS